MTAGIDHLSPAEGGAIGADKLEAARRLISSLLLARKNLSLYPEGHVIRMNSLEALARQMGAFLDRYGELKLEIERDGLGIEGEIIHTEPPEEGALPFTLYRDGLRWLAFTHGLQLAELTELLRIITRYTLLSEEPEGDIVTDLWEKGLPHIRYEAVDFFWDLEPEAELGQAPRREEDVASLRENTMDHWEPTPDPAIDPDAIELSQYDLAQIRTMVCLEEEGDPTAYLDALLDSLLQHHEQENFEIIIEIFEEEFRAALARRDFAVTFRILASLPAILDACPPEAHWAAPMIEDFFLSVSRPGTISVLLDIWPELDAVQAQKAMHTLRLLQPVAIPALAPLLARRQSAKIRDMLVDTIASLASRDMAPLESLIRTRDEAVMEKLVHVFVRLTSERATKCLVRLIRHPSRHVRQEAVKGLMKRGPGSLKDAFSLIEDKDETVRTLVLKQMGQSRDETAESILLQYLQNRDFARDQHGHVIACFTALGRCGSDRSVPFLRQTLVGQSWWPSFGRSAVREGAAAALAGIGTPQSLKVLDDAARSLNPVLRRLAREYRKG
ncbi:MAG TPA: HEAT repeat domain-containing protein [Deltaproteobacteria bacterium]|jgi:hypothetical protein|nr:HEAT repeat domain-containing protein [Deltaproteobacteria bacterium]HOI08186.1 HEAT repeat domain-containing protein [Deltaproteobacteria bacterium]